MDYTRLMDASQATQVNDRYADNLHVHKFSEEGYLYYFKSDLDAGIFDGLRFVELDDSIGSLTWNSDYKTYFLVHPWNSS